MKITKQEIISAVESSDDFTIAKEWNFETSIMIEWKGRRFFILFNKGNDDESLSDDERDIYNSASADFSVSSIFSPFGELTSEELIFDRYVIANRLNVDLAVPAMVMYREVADLYEITVMHKNFFSKPVALQRDMSKYIQGAIMSMLLSVMLATRKVSEAFSKYREDREGFISSGRLESKGRKNEEVSKDEI